MTFNNSKQKVFKTFGLVHSVVVYGNGGKLPQSRKLEYQITAPLFCVLRSLRDICGYVAILELVSRSYNSLRREIQYLLFPTCKKRKRSWI
jgi:hypothetical protein